MNPEDIAFLSVLIFIAAVLYSSVGHGGASGYLAVMALFGLAPTIMKPAGLVLNILVAGIATVRFYRAGCFSWAVFLPITLASIPFSFIGGALLLPGSIYKPIAGMILLFAAYRLFQRKEKTEKPIKVMPLSLAVISGVGIGFLSGLIGVGGGIFLSPLLVFMSWADTRKTSGISAAFILINSISGLLGHLSSVKLLPSFILYFAIAAILGGLIGSKIGIQKANNVTVRRMLAVVLVIAGVKLLFV